MRVIRIIALGLALLAVSSGTALADKSASGQNVHCDSCPVYCTRTVCDTNGCHDEQYICQWVACHCDG